MTFAKAEGITMNANAFVPETLLQAVHDIRSPLTALKVLLAELDRLPLVTQKQLVSAVVERIERIADEILQTHGSHSQCPEKSLRLCLETILVEKQFEFPDVKITGLVELSIARLCLPAADIKRVVSNFVNNAVEAGARTVSVHAQARDEKVEIIVSDDGRGLPPSVLAHFQRGDIFSWGKPGCGFGLGHAQQFAQRANGSLSLESTLNEGTRVTLAIPLAGIM
jgi:signal transduction histidine kinase